MAAELRSDGTPVVASLPSAPIVPQPNEADLFDYALIKDYLRYVLGSISRHRWFCLFVVAAVFGLTATLLWALPRTYHSETRLEAVRNQALTMAVNPGANRPYDIDEPLRGAVASIMRRDNLVTLVRQTNLIAKWPKSRAPLLRLKDRLFEFLRRGRPIPEDDQVGAMVGTLETRLGAVAAEGGISIGLDWPDGTQAYELVTAAQHNFLEQRRLKDTQPFQRAIIILEARGHALREEIEADVERVDAAREALSKKNPAKAPKAARPVVPGVSQAKLQADRQREEMRVALETKKRSIADLEDARTRNLDDLKTQLAEAQKIYSDEHPKVLELKNQIDVLNSQTDTPQLRKLREEKDALEQEALRRGAISAAELTESQQGLSRRLPTTPEQLARATTNEIEDAPIEQAKEDLRLAMSKYSQTLNQIDSNRLELQSINAGFDLRFSVITPAELPRTPSKPKVPLVLFGSVIGGLALAVFLSALRDVRAGLVFERWQVLRQLGIPILGEIHQ
ncbi:MAG TPA: hypothetical protein VH083_06825 [Myxococcales bacterium]|jgi:uncharacterized protein involved in exopolysaccharide biosynthesis|nr:hypothetical protein [Myxococcales bacterium]